MNSAERGLPPGIRPRPQPVQSPPPIRPRPVPKDSAAEDRAEPWPVVLALPGTPGVPAGLALRPGTDLYKATVAAMCKQTDFGPTPKPVESPIALRPASESPAPLILDGWHLTDLDSPSVLSGSDRLDPFHDGLWGRDLGVTWASAAVARRREIAGLGRLRRDLVMDRDEALRRFVDAPDLNSRLALLACLHAFRTMTAEQIAAFTSHAKVTSARNNALRLAWNAGLIDLGFLKTFGSPGPRLDHGVIVRPASGDVVEKKIKPALTYAEWVGITGGQEWIGSPERDQHDLLAAELALRLAEYADIGTVLGERFSTLDLLAGVGIGLPRSYGTSACDLTIVRPDGLAIGIEMTRSVSDRFKAKAEKIARAISESPLSAGGPCVVFVVADPAVLGRTREAVAAACRSYPGSVRDRVAERMGVASWADWFPQRHAISDAGLMMRVDRPTGRADQLWESCDLLATRDGQDGGVRGRPFAPSDPAAATAVIRNSAYLWQTPLWLRARVGTVPALALRGFKPVGSVSEREFALPPRLLGPAA